MDIFAAYATDEAREVDGAVVFLTSGTNPAVDPWIKVARANNMAYAKAVSVGYEKLQADKKLLRLTEDQMEIRAKNLMIDVVADTILKAFGNLEFQGTVAPQGRDAHLMFLRVKDFRELVMSHAMNVDLYRVEQKEAAAGN